MRAAARSGGGDLGITISSPEFHHLFVVARAWDRTLYTNLRKQVREAGKPLVAAVRDEIDRIPSSGRHHRGVRAGLKAGTRASILASSARTAGLRIVTTGNRLPAGKAPLVKAMNTTSFRHPVFGTSEYVAQAGRPYFATAILAHRDEVTRRVREAMDDAIDQLAASV